MIRTPSVLLYSPDPAKYIPEFWGRPPVGNSVKLYIQQNAAYKSAPAA